MVEVCEGAPVAVSGWVLADRHSLRDTECSRGPEYVINGYYIVALVT